MIDRTKTLRQIAAADIAGKAIAPNSMATSAKFKKPFRLRTDLGAQDSPVLRSWERDGRRVTVALVDGRSIVGVIKKVHTFNLDFEADGKTVVIFKAGILSIEPQEANPTGGICNM